MTTTIATQALPAGPQAPPLWQLLQWIAAPVAYLETNAECYGPNFTGQLGASLSQVVFLSEPEAIQAVFTQAPQHLQAGFANESLRPWLGNHSLLLIDGQHHRHHRRLLSPAFHGERMQLYGQLIREIALEVSEGWPSEQPFSLRDSLEDMTLRVILEVVFGLKAGQRYQQLQKQLSDLLGLTDFPLGSSLAFFPFLQKDLGPWSIWGHTKKLLHAIDDYLYAEIASRRAQPPDQQTDILSMLMQAQDDQGQGMSDVELRDELLTLLMAGHETTTTALSWAFYWIHAHDAVRQRLLDELAQAGSDLGMKALNALPYLNAVCQEALRLYPPLPITFIRVSSVPLTIGDYTFAPGTLLAPCIYLRHHCDRTFPHPKTFQPDRFLNRTYSPYEFLPFGGGNRRCIGAALALAEMKIVLATLLPRYSLTFADPKPLQPRRRTALTLAPKGKVMFQVLRSHP